MAAVLYRTRWLLRRGWKSSLGFVLVTGLIAGLALSVWSAARRGEDAYGRLLTHVDAPQYAGYFCAPGGRLRTGWMPAPCPTPYDAAARGGFHRRPSGRDSRGEGELRSGCDQRRRPRLPGCDQRDPRRPDDERGRRSVGRQRTAARGTRRACRERIGRTRASPSAVSPPFDPSTRPPAKPLDLPPQTIHLVGIVRFPSI